MAIDPVHGRLYMAYADFLLRRPFPSQVDLAACDLGNASGGRGPAGGTPAAPVCKNGTLPVPVSKNFFQGKPYFVVAKSDPRGCENEGAYPAVDPATGAVYTAYEYNIETDIFLPACFGATTPTWYSRSTPTTANTSVEGVLGVSPLTTSTPPSNVRITSVASNWLNATSVIVPNFGDYTDAALTTTGTPPFVGKTLYVAWSDGRFSVPQPFEAHLRG
jgi:hypothetical protein